MAKCSWCGKEIKVKSSQTKSNGRNYHKGCLNAKQHGWNRNRARGGK